MTEESLEDLEAQICAEMTADEEREALKERIAALERENAALREGSDIAGLSALADIREALGVGGKPCLYELAGLVRERVEMSMAAKLYVDAYGAYQRAVRRKSSRAAEHRRHMESMHRALLEAGRKEGGR